MKYFIATTTVILSILFTNSTLLAQNPQWAIEGALSGITERAMLRELSNLGRVQSSNNWGNQIKMVTGTKTERYKIKGPFGSWTWGYRPAKVYSKKNHGGWTRSWVQLDNARDTLDVKIRNFRKTHGRAEIRFQIYATCRFRGQVEYRLYSHGAKLTQVTVNGRARGHIYLNMVVWTTNNGQRIHWRAENADMKYSEVVADRVGRFGGTTAKFLGDGMTGAVRQWFPQKERDALAKAKKAVYDSISGSVDIRRQLARAMRSSR